MKQTGMLVDVSLSGVNFGCLVSLRVASGQKEKNDLYF